MGIEVAYTPLGVMVALTFIGLPFVVRTLQPALEDLDPEIEEAAASLGASRLADLPPRDPAQRPAGAVDRLCPGLCPGTGRIRLGGLHRRHISRWRREIMPMLIITKLEQFDYAGATAIGVVMLVASFVLLLTINLLQWWSRQLRSMRRRVDDDSCRQANDAYPSPLARRRRGSPRP